MIKIQHITKKFGNLKALDNLSLEFHKGECIALIGPNGCGKTTLIKAILGMVLPDDGDIIFNGTNIKQDIIYRKNIGYMPQIGRYPENMTIRQVIDIVKNMRIHQDDLDYDLYQQFEMDSMLEKKMASLSGGTTQKVSAILAFLFNPQVLILDEPTAGLDPLASEILKHKLIEAKGKNRLILITSHLLNELEDVVSQVIFMQEGRLILHKSVEDLKTTTQQKTISHAIIQLLKGQSV